MYNIHLIQTLTLQELCLFCCIVLWFGKSPSQPIGQISLKFQERKIDIFNKNPPYICLLIKRRPQNGGYFVSESMFCKPLFHFIVLLTTFLIFVSGNKHCWYWWHRYLQCWVRTAYPTLYRLLSLYSYQQSVCVEINQTKDKTTNLLEFLTKILQLLVISV